MPENQQDYPTQTEVNAASHAQVSQQAARPVQPTDHAQPAPAQQPADNTAAWKHPSLASDQVVDDENQPINDVISPVGGFPQMPQFIDRPEDSAHKQEPELTSKQVPAPAPDPIPSSAGSAPSLTQIEDLVGIKKLALSELLPLIDKLDQAPEDHFKTIMMLIQASDNDGLIKKAFDAASDIEDETAKAQALLDIVNEINYFTQLSDNNN